MVPGRQKRKIKRAAASLPKYPCTVRFMGTGEREEGASGDQAVQSNATALRGVSLRISKTAGKERVSPWTKLVTAVTGRVEVLNRDYSRRNK